MAESALFFEGRPSRVRCVHPNRLPSHDAPVAPDVREFFAQLFQTAGLEARRYRDRALLRRLPACLRAMGVASTAQAREKLLRQPELGRRALDAVLLGVTEFFRDPAVFAQLEHNVLPDLCARFRRPRIWSAACSDGQELYSVALLLDQAGRLEQCELVGTDCRADAVARARQGAFSSPGLETLKHRWSTHPIAELPGRWQLPERIRAATRWTEADILTDLEPGPWHVILCRNLAIYLDPRAAELLWTRLHHALVPGGYLVVGKADYPSRRLTLQRVATNIFRKR